MQRQIARQCMDGGLTHELINLSDTALKLMCKHFMPKLCSTPRFREVKATAP